MTHHLKSYRKFVAAAATATLVATAVTPAYAATFKDVSSNYKEAVDYLVSNKITNGISVTNFGTDLTIKRADAAVMLAKALKLDVKDAKDSGFTDVPSRAKAYVDALKEAGIVNGKTAKIFASDQNITRGEAAIMLAKAYEITGSKVKIPFTDVAVHYQDSVAALVDHNVTSGKTATSFGTGRAITRGEFAIFLHRLSKLEREEPKEEAKEKIEVYNEADLIAALEDSKITKVLLGADITSDSIPTIQHKVEIDLNGKTLKGIVKYDIPNGTDTITLASSKNGGKVQGDLSVNTPKADFIVGENVEIAGTTTIVNVKESTFYNKGILNAVVIEDHDGTSFANQGNVKGNVAVETDGAIMLMGKIDAVVVNKAADITVAESATIKSMTVTVNGVTVNAPAGTVHTIQASDGVTVMDPDGKSVEGPTNSRGGSGGSGGGTVVKTVSGNIDSFTKDAVTINGKKHKISNSLKGLFNEENNAALQGASIVFESKNGVVDKITKLELTNTTGTADKNLVLDGDGAVIDGSVIIQGDYYNIKNMTVNGDFTITGEVQNSFISDQLTVEGTMHIAEEEAKQVAAASFMVQAASISKTRITVVFKDSTIATFEIAKEDVHFTATGSTRVTTLSLQANADIFADPDVILPKVEITKGVTRVVLNATIQDVIIDSNDEIEVSGKGRFDNIVVNTDKEVKLSTTGTIKNLDMKNEVSKVSIGNDAVISDIKMPEGKTVEDVVKNFNEAKEQIDKIAGVTNPEFNEELREKEDEDYFAAGILKTDRFGYVKLNIKNQGDYQVKYLIVDGAFNSPKAGEQVPKEAIDYKENDEFILWHGHEIFVYQTDEQGKIVEVIDVNETWHFPTEWKLNDDNTLTLKTAMKTDGRSVKDLMRYVYVYQDGVANKVTNFSGYSWGESDGIPVLTINLKNTDPTKPGWIFISADRFGVSSTLNGGYDNESLNLFVLHDLARDNSTDIGWEFTHLLDHIAYEEIQKEDASGGTYISRERIAENDSVSVKAYKDELLKNKSSLQTYEAVKEMVIRINEDLKEKVDAYKKVRELTEALYKEDRYDYPQDERLREGVTQQQIDEALKAVNALSNEFVEKQWLKWDVDHAQYLLIKPTLGQIVSEFTIASTVEAGASLMDHLYKGAKPEKLRIEIGAAGQRIQKNGSHSYVVHGSRYLDTNQKELTLKTQNKTGESVIEYVGVTLYVGDYHVGNEIIAVTIESAERDESALSHETSISNRTYGKGIYRVDNDNEKKIHIDRDVTVEILLKNIVAADYSEQEYEFTNAGGEALKSGDIVADGSLFTVTSEDGQATAVYQVETVVSLTDIQLGALGELEFTAKHSNFEELQEHLNISGAEGKFTLSQVNGSQNRYKVIISDAVEHQRYWFEHNGGKLVVTENNQDVIWKIFSVERENPSINHTVIVRKVTDQVNITSSEDIDVQFLKDGEWLKQLEVDGVTIGTEITEVSNGQAKITFTTTGNDLGEINETKDVEVKVLVNGIEDQDFIYLTIGRNGEFFVNVVEK
ncbi:S-layer homology domain-containing protein [Sporosarcina sp. HYO08]|uniref:S-layer homology domain-containing protein n=1 Tax=Sporosarcina sp. HYO08 TaxID=1759557 RepID=UPI00079599DD|nr:S-layer homology domain-containing protein [Sporosarcina sp. HYO08]KXH84028.1 hypothetical protein AU377_04545 [Sporosarcina sp. HYO08]